MPPPHTRTHPFNGPFSGTTRVSRYQKGKTNLDFAEARDSEWQWHQLGHMQVSAHRSRQITMPAPHHSFFTGQMPFLPPNQQRQSTEGLRPTGVKNQSGHSSMTHGPPMRETETQTCTKFTGFIENTLLSSHND